MTRPNCWSTLLLMLLLTLLAGCGGGGERGKFKNSDRPTAGNEK